MSTVNMDTLNSLGLTQTAQQQAAKPQNKLGQADFLKLMMTQLQHQDPTKPMDNGEFISQMAQFSSVSSLQDLQTSFSNFADSMTSNQALTAAGLVGRSVLVPSQVGALSAGGSLMGSVDLPSSTSSLRLGIYDPSGQLVRQMDLGQQASGEVRFTWDGLTDAGVTAAPGTYTIKAIANVDGKAQEMNTSVVGSVASVDVNSADKKLMLNIPGVGSFEFSKVTQVM